jgi:hypothetical protein
MKCNPYIKSVEFVIDLIISFSFMENVKSFKCLHHPNFIGYVESFHDSIHWANKGRMMDTLQRFYIFRQSKLNNQTSDKLTVKPNIIFETVVQRDPHRGLVAA